MAITKNKILSEALKLSPIERAKLVEDVLSSFEFNDRKVIDKLWPEESENRVDAYGKGEISTVSYKKVFKKINK